MLKKLSPFDIALFPVFLFLSSCGGGSGGSATTDSFPVDAPLAAALVSQGLPADTAQFFAAAKFSSNCSSDTTTCTYSYTYPNGAKRDITLTANPGQYTPTADELAITATVTNPVYDGKFAATGIEDSTPPVDTHINISYFVPTSSVSHSPSANAQASPLTKKTAMRLAQISAGTSTGYQFNLSDSGSKGADVAIGSLLDYFKDTGKAAKNTGSVYAVASALSDIAGAAIISKQVNAWLAELDALEKCASDPSNPITKTDLTYTDRTVANLQATRAELKQITAVRFINAMGETSAGLHPATAVLSIPLKQVYSWTEQSLNDSSEKLMQDARKSVVSCKPSCPTNFAAQGVSESRIDLSWNASIMSSGVNAITRYSLSGGNANGVVTADTMFPDIGLAKSTQYCYTVTAYNDHGAAENCPQACGTTFGPPIVKSTGPTNSATGVAVNIAVTATFSEEVNAATVTTGTFTLAGPSGSVAGAVTYSGRTATFTPSADLKYSKTYTATVTKGVKDLDGIAMEANHTWSFTTESAPVAGNLQFSLDLAGGVIASGSASVTWTLIEDLGDVRRYAPSGTITADIDITDCDHKHTTVPIGATVLNGPGATLVVYTASNVAFANRYQFALAADPNTILTFTCGTEPNRYTISTPAPISFGVGVCTGIDLIPFTNEAQLAGKYSCLNSGLVSAIWDFSK